MWLMRVALVLTFFAGFTGLAGFAAVAPNSQGRGGGAAPPTPPLSLPADTPRVTPEQRRTDALELAAPMKSVTRKPPRKRGPSIVGVGCYESGREGEMPLDAFSPRKPIPFFASMNLRILNPSG